LASLSNIYVNHNSVETIGRVNRLISAWPTDDVLPAEGFDNLKTNYKRLSSALKEVQQINDQEVKAIDSVLEKLDVLIALRKAPESQEKRNKRPRPPSPTATASSVTPPLMSATRPVTTQATSSRSSIGPSPAIPFSREPKARREALAKQLPLQEGRKVAFHPPVGKAADGSTAEADENTWILAVITKCINQDKNRYEVQDAEPQEDGQPGQCYNTTLRAIIPLPDPSALSTSATHLNAYQEFPAGSTVMALYPDTSCFYRAEVISSPRDVPGRGVSTKTIAMYKLKFEDDDDQEHSVAAQWVVEWPGP
jgi:SAGA-associated factor 29